MDLDLAQVRAFVAVVDHQHFGRAASSLSLSQQALSKRVARLEAQVRLLVERRRGGIGLTAAGERLLPSARQLLEVADIRRPPSAATMPTTVIVHIEDTELAIECDGTRIVRRSNTNPGHQDHSPPTPQH